MAGIADRPIVVTTGTRRSVLTVDHDGLRIQCIQKTDAAETPTTTFAHAAGKLDDLRRAPQ